MGLELYLGAWMNLSGSRATGMGVGPIPWHVIDTYACRAELSPEQHEALHHHCAALDEVYLEHTEVQRQRELSNNSRGKGGGRG